MSIPISEQRRFMVGKYEVIARPFPHSMHMLRYTVFLGGTRIGALASMPSESDCRFLEKPPVVPPLKLYSVAYRPGRPKNGSKPAAATSERPPGVARDEIPEGLPLPDARHADDR